MRQFNGKPKPKQNPSMERIAFIYFPLMRILNRELPKSMRQYSPWSHEESHMTEWPHNEDDWSIGSVQSQAWHPA